MVDGKNDLREGLGIFLKWDGSKYRGIYKNGSLTCDNGHLEVIQESRLWTDSTPICFKNIAYDGTVKQSIMDGIGNIVCKINNVDKVTIEGQFKSGLLTKVESFRFQDGPGIIVEKIQDSWEDGSHKMHLTLSTQGKKYEWDGTHLKTDIKSYNHADSKVGKLDIDQKIFIAVEGLFQFESLFLAGQSFAENFEFDSFHHIQKIAAFKEEL